MITTARIAASLAIAAACTTTFAQEAVVPAASSPDAIATTPEKARQANDKAIKRSDTATVVRTGPTVGDRARQAGESIESKVESRANSEGTTIAANDPGRTTRDVTRPPKADRH